VPVRTCVGCRQRRDAADLVRVRVADGEFQTGPGPGRGAWVGPAVGCLNRAVETGSLVRALRTGADASVIARLVVSWPHELPACPHGGV